MLGTVWVGLLSGPKGVTEELPWHYRAEPRYVTVILPRVTAVLLLCHRNVSALLDYKQGSSQKPHLENETHVYIRIHSW